MLTRGSLPFEGYVTLPGVNWSTLKVLHAESPLHYRHALDEPREDADPLRLGRAVHTLLFEPDRFATDYATWTGEARRGKAWEEFEAEHDGRTVLTADQATRAQGMARALLLHPASRRYLERGQAEQAIQWTERVHLDAGPVDIACKARVDHLEPHLHTFSDLKSCGRTLVLRRFAALAERYGYFHQMAWCRRGIRKALGLDLSPVLLAVESKPPHDVGVFPVHSGDVKAADEEISSLLMRLAHHRMTDVWPGRYPEEQVIERPRWAYPEDGEDLDAED